VRLAPFTAPLVALALLPGCGGDSATSDSDSVATPVPMVRAAWERTPSCHRPDGASRWGCSVGSYRCQGVVTDRGWSISCAKPGKSVAFTVRP
jgi:hypothetical protein